MRGLSRSIVLSLAILGFGSSIHADQHVDLNIGTSPKSGVGLSYGWGKNSINAGLLGLGFNNPKGYLVQPGLSFNRQFTEDGWYWSVGYSLYYKSHPEAELSTSTPGFTDWEHVYNEGWQSGEILVGMGQNFQWGPWGVNVDGGIGFSTDSEFFRPLGFRAGIGGSYRFQIN